MKSHARNLALLLPALLLLASALTPTAEAAKAPLKAKSLAPVKNATEQNSRANPTAAADGPIANIDENWYLELTGAYVKTDGLLNRFTGASLALGWRITQQDKLQLEIGYYASNNYTNHDYTYRREDTPDVISGQLSTIFTFNGTRYGLPVTGRNYTLDMAGTRRAKGTMMPVLFSYSSVFKLNARETLELRLTPIVGFVVMNSTWSVDAKGSYSEPDLDTTFESVTPTDGLSKISDDGKTITRVESFSGKDSNYLSFVMGGGFALSYAITPRWYVESGYRYIWTAKASNKTNIFAPTGTPWNGLLAWNGMNAHFYSVTLGMKF